ncbi:hypothetical protein [Halobacillus sp. K22]|uniref:hypothetical protein n=1 Tax=Halobacillus sp. K22 TaxID=3457431 RepID=UPI003FCD84D2
MMETKWADLHPNAIREAIEVTQNFEVINGEAYDTETGENISDKVDVRPRLTEGQMRGQQIKENLKAHQTENGGYVFALFQGNKAIEERFPSLTQSDLARLMFIGTYVSYDDSEAFRYGLLKHPNGVKIGKKSLEELLGMSRSKYSGFYKKLLNEGILAETDEGLEINPAVFYRGEHVKAIKGEMRYTRLFRQTVRDLYELYNGRSIKKLGVIYSVLPYVNFNFNVLAENPSEVKADEVKPLTIEELAEKLGYEDEKKLTQTLRSIKYDGQPIFGFVEISEDRRRNKIVVNPRVIYAGNGKHLDTIKMLFK